MISMHEFKLSGSVSLILRIFLAILGGYAFCWGFIALCTSGLFVVGMEFHDSEGLGSILALLLYPLIFLWVFIAHSLKKVGAVLMGGGALMTAIASFIQILITGAG